MSIAIWGARPSRSLVAVSRRDELSPDGVAAGKVREGETPSPTTGTVALPGGGGSVLVYFLPAQFLQFVEDRAEDIGLVVRDDAGEIGEIFCALDHRGDALQAHAGIDVPLRQWRERSVRVRVELDENEVPNLDAARVARVDQRALGVTGRREIDVQFRARTARAGIAHHPEVVLLVPVDDVHSGIEPRLLEQPRPMIVRFPIELARLAGTRSVNRRVKP